MDAPLLYDEYTSFLTPCVFLNTTMKVVLNITIVECNTPMRLFSMLEGTNVFNIMLFSSSNVNLTMQMIMPKQHHYTCNDMYEAKT